LDKATKEFEPFVTDSEQGNGIPLSFPAAVLTDLAALITMAKQGASRPLFGGTLATTIITFSAAYNNVYLVIANQTTTDSVWTVTHNFSGGAAIYTGTVAALSTTMATIPGVASTNTLTGIVGASPVTLGVYGSTE